MELELALKMTQTRDDLTSMADFQFAKDRAGPVFLSREDDNMFILTVHLKGFERENIVIKINEDGTRITVRGEKPVQQTVLIGWIVHKKGVELRVFRKDFKIPDGVVLDRIKAKFNEEESILTIVMPKRGKGIRGDGIKEMNEEEVGSETGKSERKQVVDNKVPERDKVGVKIQEESKEPQIKRMEETDRVVEKETDREGSEKTKIVEEVLRKDTTGERIHEERKEPKIPHQIAEEEAGKLGFEATKTVAKEFPKKEYIGKKVPEKTEQPKIKKMEETDGVVKDTVGRGKPETVQTVADEEPKREKEAREPVSKIAKETQQVAETSKKTKEINHERELGEAAPKYVEPVLTPKQPEVEPAVVKPGSETDRPQTKELPPPIEETWSKELPALTEQTKKQEIPEVEKVEENGLEEGKSTKDEFVKHERELGEAAPKYVEPVLTPKQPEVEPTVVKPGSETDRPQTKELPPPTEETCSKELPALTQQTKKQEIPEVEKVEENGLEEEKSTKGEFVKHERELGAAAPKYVEPVLTPKQPEVEPTVVKPGSETDRPQTKELPPPIEETWSKELPALTEQTKKQEIPEVEKVEENGLAEGKSTKDEFVKHERELGEAAPKYVEPVLTPKQPEVEPTVVKPGSETDRPQTKELPPPTEETCSKELPALTQQTKKQEIPEVEKVEENGLEEEKSTKGEFVKHERELGAAAPKYVEPVLTPKQPEVEPTVVKPGSETDRPQTKELPPPTEETCSKELPALTEQTKKQEIPEVEKVEENGLEEDKSTKDEFRQAEHKMPQEPQKQVSHTDVEESTKSKTDQEPEQEETPQPQHPVERHRKDEVTEREQTYSTGNKIQEANNERSCQEKCESTEGEKDKDTGEGATQEKEPGLKRRKLLAPRVVAGSAILVSITAFVIHMIRAKKK